MTIHELNHLASFASVLKSKLELGLMFRGCVSVSREVYLQRRVEDTDFSLELEIKNGSRVDNNALRSLLNSSLDFVEERFKDYAKTGRIHIYLPQHDVNEIIYLSL